MLFRSVLILTVNQLRLFRMQCETALESTLPYCFENELSFLFAATVDQRIISLSLKPDLLDISFKPMIKRIMHKQIRQ